MTDARVGSIHTRTLVTPHPAARVGSVHTKVLVTPHPSTRVGQVKVRVLMRAISSSWYDGTNRHDCILRGAAAADGSIIPIRELGWYDGTDINPLKKTAFS